MSEVQSFPIRFKEEKTDQAQEIGVCGQIAKSFDRAGALGLAIIGKAVAFAGTLTAGGVNGILVPVYIIDLVIGSAGNGIGMVAGAGISFATVTVVGVVSAMIIGGALCITDTHPHFHHRHRHHNHSSRHC